MQEEWSSLAKPWHGVKADRGSEKIFLHVMHLRGVEKKGKRKEEEATIWEHVELESWVMSSAIFTSHLLFAL